MGWGKAAFWLLVPAGLIKLVSMLCLYKRTYATADTPGWRWLGVFTEFACFCALLGVTIQFYSGCWRYLPNDGSRMHFPVFRAADIFLMNRGDAAAATWI